MPESPLTRTREEILDDLRRNPHATFCVIGGGVHGAAFARIAARNGLTCVLVERSDYASGTSSRSSKMLHGGLRYLESLDFQQVYEGIQAREDLYATARHLCRPTPFLIPVPRGDWKFRLKLGLGMRLYDAMGTPVSRRHRYLSRRDLRYTGFHAGRDDLDGCYEYSDGLVEDDGRLVLESILDARTHGARCLNYLEAVTVSKAGNRFRIGCRDRLGGGELELTADRIINCAGPWVPCLAASSMDSLASRLRYSAGVHLLFDRPWPDPCLFLPMSERGRYYFVWPFANGCATMVGTTERQVEKAEYDPLPTPQEVEEILARLERDLPEAGLNRQTLYYGFSGVRTLALRGQAQGTARLSRKHLWTWTDGVLNLLGGKLTTANWTAWEGFRLAVQSLGLRGDWQNLTGQPYPGSGTLVELAELKAQLTARGLPPEQASRLVTRSGMRARPLLDDETLLTPVAPGLTQGQIELALREEQAATLEDLLRRRAGLEYLPDGVQNALEAIQPFLARARGSVALAEERAAYCQRLEKLKCILRGD